MLRPRDYYEPEVWEIEEAEELRDIEESEQIEEVVDDFNDLMRMVFSGLQDTNPDYRAVWAQKIC